MQYTTYTFTSSDDTSFSLLWKGDSIGIPLFGDEKTIARHIKRNVILTTLALSCKNFSPLFHEGKFLPSSPPSQEGDEMVVN